MGVKIIVQGISIEVDSYLLNLGGYEYVLGAQCLQIFGWIVWNLFKLTMKFILDN